jgi:hypothetical protein
MLSLILAFVPPNSAENITVLYVSQLPVVIIFSLWSTTFDL